MSAPKHRLLVKRLFKNTDGTQFHPVVGDLALWEDKDGKLSGTLRLFGSGQTLKIYPEREAKE